MSVPSGYPAGQEGRHGPPLSPFYFQFRYPWDWPILTRIQPK